MQFLSNTSIKKKFMYNKLIVSSNLLYRLIYWIQERGSNMTAM